MNVTEKRVVQVQEDIDVFFFNDSHGIFRNIPLRSQIVRADGSNELSRAAIKNIKVSESYIKIEDNDRSFSLHKLKEYTGKNSIEKRLIKALFENGDIISKESHEGSYTFYQKCQSLINSLNNSKKFIFDKDACSWGKIIIIVSIF